MCGQEGDEAVRGPSATLRDSSQVECGNHSSSMLVGNLFLSDCLGTGDVVEHQVGLEAEEVAEAVVERHFDPVFGGVELVEGAVPGVELSGMDADPPALVPVRDEASALAVADEVGLEPAGEAVLAGGR